MNPAEQQLREIEKPEQCDFPSSLHCPSCSGNLYFIANLSLDKETGHMTIRYIYFCLNAVNIGESQETKEKRYDITLRFKREKGI